MLLGDIGKVRQRAMDVVFFVTLTGPTDGKDVDIHKNR